MIGLVQRLQLLTAIIPDFRLFSPLLVASGSVSRCLGEGVRPARHHARHREASAEADRGRGISQHPHLYGTKGVSNIHWRQCSELLSS